MWDLIPKEGVRLNWEEDFLRGVLMLGRQIMLWFPFCIGRAVVGVCGENGLLESNFNLYG